MEQPAKTLMPLPLELTGLVVQLSVPLPAVTARFTGLEVTRLPPASFTVTWGWMAKALPPVAVVLGWVLKVSEAAGPTVMLNVELGAEAVLRLSVASVAVRV